MSYGLQVRYEAPDFFVATDVEPKPVRVIVDCPQGIPAGADVRVSITTFHSYTQQWQLDGIEIQKGSGRFVLGHGLPRAWHQMTRGGVGPAGGGLIGRPVGEIYLCTIQVMQAITPGAQLVFRFGAAVSPHADVEGSLVVKVRAPGTDVFNPVGEPHLLDNTPGPAARLEVRCSAASDANGAHHGVVFATDALLNPIPEGGTVRLSADGPVEGLPERVEIGADGRAVIEGLTIGGDRPVRIEAVDERRGFSAKSGPVPPADANFVAHGTGHSVAHGTSHSVAHGTSHEATPRKHFFGALHFHTRLSVDGDREPRRAYAYARDFLNLDVIAMTDHAPIGPLWEEALRVNEEFYEPGRFVTIPAWESSNAYGHANLYLRSPDSIGGPWLWNPDVCPSEVEWPADVVMVPHHTNAGQIFERGTHREAADRGVYWEKYDWSMPNPRARLVEVVQGRGNFEADALDETWGIRMGNQGASIQDAFAKGWRLGFVAGTDNHEGHPTQRGGSYVGMTCFRAAELTREAIWQAMDQRQTYATSGVPIVCDFAVNETLSGGEMEIAEGAGVWFSARLHGTAPIEIVEIISNGACVWQGRPNQWDVELDGIELPQPDVGSDAYYYLRLRQADGHRAWLSPVWVTRRAGA